MTSLTDRLLSRPRLTLGAAVLLALVGLVAWRTMPRLEDPEMPRRWALVVSAYPGADPFTIERTIMEPIEEALAEVQELGKAHTTIRTGVAITNLELGENIDVQRIEDIWDDVDKALVRARRKFPEGASEPRLDRDISDPEAVVFALTGTDSIELVKAARRVERALLALPGVARVKRIGDSARQVTIGIDEAAVQQVGLSTRALAEILRARQLTIPAGSIDLDGRTTTLQPDAEFHSIEEIAATPIALPSGAAVPLSELAEVRLGSTEPASERMRMNGRRAVGIGVVPTRPTNLVRFGEVVRAAAEKIAPELGPVELSEVAFQPRRVEKRLQDLGGSLLEGMIIVGAVLVLTMGLRLGLVVSVVVPLVAAASLGLFAVAGGVLHQMSIAALVIALGMLVDNAIVVAENVQARIDRGQPTRRATLDAARELAVPLGTATGTTVAAFIPMLLSRGSTADFTRALPIVISLTLVVSYLFALLVTPTLARLLVARRQVEVTDQAGWASRIGALAVRRRYWVLLGAIVLVAVNVGLATRVEKQFFPGGDRNQLVIDVTLPEGSSLDRTDQASAELERAVLGRPEVLAVASFIGRGAPHFYYNVVSGPSTPHSSQLVVTTTDVDTAGTVQRWVRQWVVDHLPEAQVVARKLEQGPQLRAAVEVRLYGHSLQGLVDAGDQVLESVRSVEGTRDTRETLGGGVPAMRVEVDDASASRLGLSRSDVVVGLLGQISGLRVGELRTGDDPVPILLRSREGQRSSLQQLASLTVSAGGASPGVPLAALSRMQARWQPAAIERRERSRVVSVLAELEDGYTFSEVERRLRLLVSALDLPDGVRVEFGGAGESADDANEAILLTMPLGVLVLFSLLLLEFNSYRRVAVILSTVPLAAAGVVPGLLLGEQPFGFMSMLGVIALCGVVVNNAIVLLDLADQLQREGLGLEQAMREAVSRRIRPILLTTCTTVAGLVPLAVSSTTLWPPLAWSMISGLVGSTLLTLLVVPALYVILLSPWPRRFWPTAKFAAIAGVAGCLVAWPTRASAQPSEVGAEVIDRSAGPSGTATADLTPFDLESALRDAGPPITLAQVVERAVSHDPRLRATEARVAAAQARVSESRLGLWPRVGLSARYTRLNEIDSQPLVDPALLDQARQGIVDVADPNAESLFSDLFDAFEVASAREFSSPPNQVELVASVEVPLTDIFLRARPETKAVEAGALAHRSRQRSAEHDVVLRARRAYYDYAKTLGALAVVEQAEGQARAQLVLVESLASGGRASQADRMSALARLESVRAQRARLEGRMGTARAALLTLIGEDDREVGVVGVLVPFEADSRSRETLVQSALDRRPELESKRHLHTAQRHAERAARAGIWPEISALGNLRYANPNMRFQPPEEEFRTSWDVGALLRWSPSEAARSKRQAAAIESAKAATRAELDALEDQIRVEVIRAFESRVASERAAQAALSGQRAAEEAYRVRRLQLGAGAALTTDVLEADLAVSRARVAYLQSVLEVGEASAALERAVGGPRP